MARGNADLPPKMQLRQKTSESQRHPGRVTDYDWEDDPASTVTIGEKVEERAQKKVEKEKVDKARKNAQSKLAAIEDRLRREDVDRELTANHPPVAVTPKPKAQPKPANIPEQTPTAGAKLKAQAKTAQIPSEQTAAAKPGTKASHPKTSQTPTPAPKTPAPAPKPAAPVSAKPSAAKTTKTRETAVINSESRARRSTTASQI
ncbi:hypothetical protein BDZ89DRAFT_481716 [Hymenopellis radicata]|nr:hypothetical protein BDZ89DRAFT_481716 [Hymenopellis radicata]